MTIKKASPKKLLIIHILKKKKKHRSALNTMYKGRGERTGRTYKENGLNKDASLRPNKST